MNGVRFVLQLNGGMGAILVLAVLLVPLTGARIEGVHTSWFLAVIAFGLCFVAPVLWRVGGELSPAWVHLLALVYETGALTIGVLAIGDVLSPFVVPFYMVQGVAVAVVFNTRAALAHLIATGTSYAAIVALQDGNVAPLSRWVLAMGAVVITGLAVSMLVEKTRQLAKTAEVARAQLQCAHHKLEVAHGELASLTQSLGIQVAEQVDEMGRLSRLRRFLSTPVADVVLSADNDDEFMRPHRREIAVLFCDLRAFTEFAASSQPEDVHHVLDEYFELLGESIRRHGATVGAFTGDGLMAFFNDPLPCPDPALKAITMACEIQHAMESMLNRWRPRGYGLGLGVGIALGYADIGMIGFEGRRDYSALGTVVNLASRLCDEARAGEILIDERAHAATQHAIVVDDSALISLKGLREPVLAFSARLTESDQLAGGVHDRDHT
ncbi:MAG: adenylate cyclase [Actinomycetota bacterium]